MYTRNDILWAWIQVENSYLAHLCHIVPIWKKPLKLSKTRKQKLDLCSFKKIFTTQIKNFFVKFYGNVVSLKIWVSNQAGNSVDVLTWIFLLYFYFIFSCYGIVAENVKKIIGIPNSKMKMINWRCNIWFDFDLVHI